MFFFVAAFFQVRLEEISDCVSWKVLIYISLLKLSKIVNIQVGIGLL